MCTKANTVKPKTSIAFTPPDKNTTVSIQTTPTTTTVTTITTTPVQYSVGLDLDDGDYYLEICDNKDIEIDISKPVTNEYLIKKFIQINQLDRPGITHPIHSLIKEVSGVDVYTGKVNTYKYYDPSSTLVDSDDVKSPVDHIWTMMTRLLMTASRIQIEFLTSEINRNHNQVINTEKAMKALRKIMINPYTFSIKVDQMFGAGTFDLAITNVAKFDTSKYNDKADDLVHTLDKPRFKDNMSKLDEQCKNLVIYYFTMNGITNYLPYYDQGEDITEILTDALQVQAKNNSYFSSKANKNKFISVIVGLIPDQK